MANNKIMGDIFTEMVMKEAAADRLTEYDKENSQVTSPSMDNCQKYEDDRDLMELRESRIQRLKTQRKEREENIAKGHGEYQEVCQDEFLPAVTKSNLVVCHFYHKDFERCKLIDKHLYDLAPKFIKTRFIRINAEKSPFFVEKLKIRTLPTIVLFDDGLAYHHLIGFSEMGGSDYFPTSKLAKVLFKHKSISQDTSIMSEDEED
eukprot:GHVL01035364.1.p1 GENE.GHVL01035364.1~~GHVL01035364.1.p1  ORF type:complete len:205 (+),score=33.10 GHVL01035364.1:236-850(+)